MTGPVSTAAAATLAPASASAPPAGWASNASTAGAASGEWRVVLEGRAQPEVEAKGRSRQFQARGGCWAEIGVGKPPPPPTPNDVSGPFASREIIFSGLGSSCTGR